MSKTTHEIQEAVDSVFKVYDRNKNNLLEENEIVRYISDSYQVVGRTKIRQIYD